MQIFYVFLRQVNLENTLNQLRGPLVDEPTNRYDRIPLSCVPNVKFVFCF